MCGSALQCVAVCCSVLQRERDGSTREMSEYVAVCGSVSQCVSMSACVVVCCSVFQCVALCCIALQHVAV